MLAYDTNWSQNCTQSHDYEMLARLRYRPVPTTHLTPRSPDAGSPTIRIRPKTTNTTTTRYWLAYDTCPSQNHTQHHNHQIVAVWCESITDASLWALSRLCSTLEAVHVAGCEGVSSAAVTALRENGLEVLR